MPGPLPRFAAFVAALVVAASPAAGQVLRGTVVDSASGQPIAGARVTAFSMGDTRVGDAPTDSGGGFAFRLPAAGAYVLLTQRLGYAAAVSQPITVTAAGRTVRIGLQQVPVPLEPVTVVGDTGLVGRRVPWLADQGFYKREREGFGSFLTRREIEKKDPLIVSDLLKGMSGVRVRCSGPVKCTITMQAANSMFLGKPCAPSVVLDGAVVSVGGSGGSGSVDWLDPHNLEAIEVYPGPAGVPVQYSGYMSPCGAILLWSRR